MPRIAPRVALIGTLVYMLIVVAVLVVPASAPHVRRGFLLDIAGGRRLAIDVVLNVAIFIPIGWGLRRASQGLGTTVSAPMARVVVLAAAFSLAMEAVQAWLPNRYSSLADVVANTIGATVGAWMESRFRRRV